jgi:hypothetical protein
MLPFSSVDLLPVIISTLAAMVLGMIWYGPLFGKTWMGLVGIKMPKPKEANKVMCKSMSMGLVNTFVGVYVLALLLAITQPATLHQGLLYGALLWLGFSATAEASGNIWAGTPWKLFWINGAYGLIATLISVTILMKWMW